MNYPDAMRLLIARSPATSTDAAKTIRRLSVGSPVAIQVAQRLITAALGDPEADWTSAERAALAGLLTGDESDTRTTDLHIRITPTEKRRLNEAAAAAGLSISDYIRQRVEL